MKVCLISLGCDKNLVDSEKMLGRLSDSGYTITDDEEAVDIAVVNTCCFIQDAQKESIETLLRLGERRTGGSLKCLVAVGCLAQRFAEDIRREIPEVDAILGTTAGDRLTEAVESVLSGNSPERYIALTPLDKPAEDRSRRILSTYTGYAYLKIAEGCDKRCTYCVIPSIRGPYRSVPMEALIEEAEKIASAGVKELILVAQETTIYGVDLYGKRMLPELLRRLCRIEGLSWIRILYCYPEEITDELIGVMASEPKIVHYLDMPVQHASDAVLKAMRRRTNRAELTERIAKLRAAMPDITLRTTLISGFPGETEEDHAILADFVRSMRFDRLGVFTYSREAGTPAAAMKPQIKSSVKKSRQRELMLIQQEIAFENARAMKGRVLEAMVEGQLAGEEVYVARTYMDAPDVDGLMFIETGRELVSGEIVRVKVTGSKEYDLTGKLVTDK